MAEDALIDKVQGLSDLELATLLCLTAQEHCIIDTEPDALDDLVLELRLVSDVLLGARFHRLTISRLPQTSLVFLTLWSTVPNTLPSMTSPTPSSPRSMQQPAPTPP